MNLTDVLSPEIVDLGLAVGLLTRSGPGGDHVDFDNAFFDDPGPRLRGTLADDARRAALVRFVDAVNGPGDAQTTGGVTLVKLFNVADLGVANPPDLTLNLALDAGPAHTGYVEVGLAVSFATGSPVTRTDLLIPLYRVARTGQPAVAEAFALKAGAPLRVATRIVVDQSGGPNDLALHDVALTASVPVTGVAPTAALRLGGLRFPGATAPTDIEIGGPGVSLEQTLLSLVLGVLRATVGTLGAAATQVNALLELVGLGPNPALPPVDVGALASRGVSALRDWFSDALGVEVKRAAWLDALASLLGGVRSGDDVRKTLAPGLSLSVGLRVAPGAGGHLRLTPHVGLSLETTTDGVRVAAVAEIDALTLDVADGALTAVPRAEVRVALEGVGGRLLPAGPVQIGGAAVGLTYGDAALRPLLRLSDVQVGTDHHDVLDLSSADAVVAALNQTAAGLVGSLLDNLGAPAPHLKTLLGLTPPADVPPLEVTRLLVDPLGALRTYWSTLVRTHAAKVPAVLAHLQQLIATNAAQVFPPEGTGIEGDPWTFRLTTGVTLEAWLEGSRLVMAVALGTRIDDLAGGCTVVTASVRVDLLSIDLDSGAPTLLRGAALALTFRGRGQPNARLALGPVAIVATRLGIAVRWTAASGLSVGLEAPDLAAEIDGASVPLALPTGADWRGAALADLEGLVGVLGASNPSGWLNDLVDLLGWTVGGEPSSHRLSLAALASDPAGPAAVLAEWGRKLATDAGPIARLTTTAARILTGSTQGLAGALSGLGAPESPWVLPFSNADLSAGLSVVLGPEGPTRAATATADALRTWSPGMPGLPPAGLAQAVLSEALVGATGAGMAFGRDGLAAGFEALAQRVAGTDVRVAPPPTPLPGVDVVVNPGFDHTRWASLPIERLLGAAPAAGAAVLHVAVGTPANHPFGAVPAGRLLDLSPAGLAPAAFTVPDPAPGAWYVTMAPRAVARLGVADPSGVDGQAARLGAIVAAFASSHTVVLVAHGGAGHCARVTARTSLAVTHLVTLGTPWSAVAFDTVRGGLSGDALRVAAALLPAPDAALPDDPDLALGRAIVGGLMDSAAHAELEAPRGDLSVRGGLVVRAWFGGLTAPAVERALTAVVAAGLSARALARAAATYAPATDAQIRMRLPILGTPPGATGVQIAGHVELGLVGATFSPPALGARPSVNLRLTLSDAEAVTQGAWLVGGPGSPPLPGAPALELRFVEIDVQIGLGGAPSAVTLVLHDLAALGARYDRLVVRADAAAEGALATSPLLPEARAALGALVQRLRALATASAAPAAVRLLRLLDGLGLSTPAGLVPDVLAHLIHDPVAFVQARLSDASARLVLATALAELLPGGTRTGEVVSVTVGQLTATLDFATRRAGFSAALTEGALPVSLAAAGLFGPSPTGSLTVGDPGFNGGALRLTLNPFSVALVRADAAGAPVSVAVHPQPDLDAIAGFVLTALPAEATRLLLDGLRGLDATVGAGIEAVAAALKLLGPVDPAHPAARRRIAAPVALFADPGGWLQQHVLGLDAAAAVERATDLFEALKPFLGLSGTPRGAWPLTSGVALTVTSGAGGPTLSVAVDPTAWLGGGGAATFAAGLTLGLTVRADAAPVPAVALYAGAPESPPTAQHRRAVHLRLDAAGLAAFLRPATGADIPLLPNPAGLGALLAAGAEMLLPMALDAVARLNGDQTRNRVAALVCGVGRGLAVVQLPAAAGVPVTFDGAKLKSLAENPPAWLSAHLGTLLPEIATALAPLLGALPGAPSVASAPSGAVTLNVRGVTLTLLPTPLTVTLAGSVGGLDLVQRLSASVTLDASGLGAWAFGIGAARIPLGSPAATAPTLRPLVRGGYARAAGWDVSLGLALDDLAPTVAGHHELLARWRSAGGLVLLARTRGADADADVLSTDDPGKVALFAGDALLELLGNWVIGMAPVSGLLNTAVGAGPTVRSLLSGSLLNAGGTQIAGGALSALPGSLFTLARNVLGALPDLPLGPFALGIHRDGDLFGLRLDINDHEGGLPLNPDGDVVIALVTDASWIDPAPPGGATASGLVVDVLRLTAGTPPAVTIEPRIAANGLGVRISKREGPLLDAGLRLDALAVHLFGEVESKPGGVALSGGVQVELEGLAVPLAGGGGSNAVAQNVVRDAGGAGAPPTPKFSPALAVQAHDGQNGVGVSLRAGSGDGPWYLPIQRAFGPVYLEQIGLGTTYTQADPNAARKLETVSVSLDGSVSLFGITASVDKLRLTYHVSRPFLAPSSWEVDLDGFALSSSIGGLTLVGALRRAPLSAPLVGTEYLGMLKIGFSGYGVDLFGGYAQPTIAGESFASFFAFGALHGPLGGPPAFFITGIGLGLGINRNLEPPTIESLPTNVFLSAMRASGPPPEPMRQLEDMRRAFAPVRGQYWVAAGISFTSFVLITGEVVVTVAFGDGLDIAVLGLARAQLPTADLTLVSIELALLARFSTKEGLLLVQAQLTENSWLLTPSARLTGGFAFATWWKGPNAGQFVLTIGGYHPKFHHDGYPVVPRLGLRWQPADNISIVGESYFALCSEALMAGVRFDAQAHFGPAHARLTFGCDGIVYFDPFWFEVSAYAQITAGIRIWLLFGTVDLEFSLGASLTVSGPPIYVHGYFEICGFEIPFAFGDEGNRADMALSNTQFTDKYLRSDADAKVLQASVLKGAVPAGRTGDGQAQRVPDGSPGNPFLVQPEFELVVITTAPAVNLSVHHGVDPAKSLALPNPDLGVAPMFSADLSSDLIVELVGLDHDDFDLDDVHLRARPNAAFPKGVWGEARPGEAAVIPAGETVDAPDGLILDTLLGERDGAPEVAYNQVELPFGGRKPLPFVTGRAQTNLRVAESLALKVAADAVRPLEADVTGRFHAAARILAAGGHGALGVAALRGQRAAAPQIGSLADDLVIAPEAIAPAVVRTEVSRVGPGRRLGRPVVKSLLAAPATQSTGTQRKTTVSQPGKAIARVPPTLNGMRAALAGVSSAALIVRPPATAVARREANELDAAHVQRARTVLPRGVAAVTRLASSPVGAVQNARPGPAAFRRLKAVEAQLYEGATLHEGELLTLGVPGRPEPGHGDVLRVSGGPTRILALGAGGNVLFDNANDGQDKSEHEVRLPAKTERVTIAALGASSNCGGPLPGWYLGQRLPVLGWGSALGAGVVVSAPGNEARPHRERGDGGFTQTRELAAAPVVSTRFDAPIRALAVALDDAGMSGAAAADPLDLRLVGAHRRLGPDGELLPPMALVQGVRTVLIFAIEPDDAQDRALRGRPDADPCVYVVVGGTRRGHLAGVAGCTSTVKVLLDTLATHGFDAAIGAPLPAGPGTRTVAWRPAPGRDGGR